MKDLAKNGSKNLGEKVAKNLGEKVAKNRVEVDFRLKKVGIQKVEKVLKRF